MRSRRRRQGQEEEVGTTAIATARGRATPGLAAGRAARDRPRTFGFYVFVLSRFGTSAAGIKNASLSLRPARAPAQILIECCQTVASKTVVFRLPVFRMIIVAGDDEPGPEPGRLRGL